MVGGAEVAVKEITDRLPDIEFDMVTMRFDKNHKSVEKLGNVTVYRIASSKLLFPIDAAFFARKLYKKKPYDLIWSIMAARAGGAALFFKYTFPNVRFILTLQEGDPIEYMMKRSLAIINPFFKKIFTNADFVQAISNYLIDYAETMGYRGPSAVIPNGVDFRSFQAFPDPARLEEITKRLEKKEGDIFLITTSRLVKKNAIDDCIKAIALLPTHIKFLILGTGQDQKILESLARRSGVSDRVKFLGHVDYKDIPLYLHASDIFIRPSIAEGFGNSFIEAMAAGLPVIATPVGGIIDFLFDPDKDHDMPPTGLFVNVRDPESIKTQVLRLLANPDLKQKLIENGQKLAKEKYEWDLVARDMKEKVFDKAQHV